MPTLDVVIYSVIMTTCIGVGILGGIFADMWSGYTHWKDVVISFFWGVFMGLFFCGLVWCLLWVIRAAI